jgi:hypothetical protein
MQTTRRVQDWTDDLEQRRALVVVAAAFGLGIVWGGLARGWMRVISTDPYFTMSGSVFIAGEFSFSYTSPSVALVARRWRLPVLRTAGRLVGLLGMLPLFIGGGAVMLPTVVGGGLAVGQHGWPRPVRALAAAVALFPVAAVGASLIQDFGLGAQSVGGVVGLVVVYAGVVCAVTASLGRARDARPLPRPLRLATIVVAVAVLLFATVGLAGLRG